MKATNKKPGKPLTGHHKVKKIPDNAESNNK